MRSIAQVETQLNKTKGSQKAQQGETEVTGKDKGDVDEQSFPSFRAGLATNMPVRVADGNQSLSRQQSKSEGQNRTVPGDPLMMPANSPQTLMVQQSIPEGREYSSTSEPEKQTLRPMAGNLAPDMYSNPGMSPDPQLMGNLDLGLDANYSWEMIGLGLEEPMPMQEAIDELYAFVVCISCLVLIQI